MSEISARCFLFVGNISATICKNLIFKIFYLVRKVFLICAKSDNYPDNWSVTKEECDQQEELVTLENDGGASVTFLHYSGELQGGGSGVYMNKEEISKVASSQFIPGFVQATDHSSLGEFMVARIKTIGKLNMQTDREYKEVDGNVAYAVLPVSEEGIREGVRRAISGEYTFWYSSTISFTASTSEEFTPQEEKEVIAILSSFRIA